MPSLKECLERNLFTLNENHHICIPIDQLNAEDRRQYRGISYEGSQIINFSQIEINHFLENQNNQPLEANRNTPITNYQQLLDAYARNILDKYLDSNHEDFELSSQSQVTIYFHNYEDGTRRAINDEEVGKVRWALQQLGIKNGYSLIQTSDNTLSYDSITIDVAKLVANYNKLPRVPQIFLERNNLVNLQQQNQPPQQQNQPPQQQNQPPQQQNQPPQQQNQPPQQQNQPPQQQNQPPQQQNQPPQQQNQPPQQEVILEAPQQQVVNADLFTIQNRKTAIKTWINNNHCQVNTDQDGEIVWENQATIVTLPNNQGAFTYNVAHHSAKAVNENCKPAVFNAMISALNLQGIIEIKATGLQLTLDNVAAAFKTAIENDLVPYVTNDCPFTQHQIRMKLAETSPATAARYIELKAVVNAPDANIPVWQKHNLARAEERQIIPQQEQGLPLRQQRDNGLFPPNPVPGNSNLRREVDDNNIVDNNFNEPDTRRP